MATSAGAVALWMLHPPLWFLWISELPMLAAPLVRAGPRASNAQQVGHAFLLHGSPKDGGEDVKLGMHRQEICNALFEVSLCAWAVASRMATNAC